MNILRIIIIGLLITPLAAFVLTVGFATGFANSAAAQDPYEIADMRLDVVGNSDREAKNEALKLAESRAFDKLLDRLLLQKETRVKEVLRKRYKDAALSLLIADLSIANERFGAGRYLADVTVRFKARAVRRIFAENNLAYAETYSAPLLVISLQKKDGRTAVWADDNMMLKAVRENELPQGLLPLTVPYGDIEDINLLNPQTLRASSVGSFRRFDFADIIERYDVGGVLFMQGIIENDDIIIKGRMLASGNSVDFPEARYDFSGDDEEIIQATLAALGNFQELWKSRNLISDENAKTLHAVLQVRSLEKLHDDLRILRQVTIIDKAHLLRLSTRQAVIAIDFRSSLSQLQATLFNHGLRLDRRESNGNWYLRRL